MEHRIHFGVRILAYLIDIAALFVISIIVFGAGGWLWGSGGTLVPNDLLIITAFLGSFMGIFFGFFVIGVVLLLWEGITGDSIGKKILKIRSMDKEGIPCDRKRLIARSMIKNSWWPFFVPLIPGVSKIYLLPQISTYTAIFLLPLVYLGFFLALGKQRQALHDKITYTAIFSTNQQPPNVKKGIVVLLILVMLIPFSYFSIKGFSVLAEKQAQKWAQNASLPELIEQLPSDKYYYTQCATIELLTRGKQDPQITIEFIRALRNINWETETKVHKSLAKMGQEAIPPLASAMENSTPLIKSEIVKLLGYIKVKESFVLLVNVLQETHITKEVAINTIGSLASFGKKTVIVIDDLIPYLESKNKRLKEKTIETIGQIGPEAKTATPHLLKCLDDTDAIIRGTTMETLALMKSEVAIPALVEAVKDTDNYVKKRAVQAIADIGKPTEVVIATLLETLKDSDEEIRQISLEGIGNLGPKAAKAVPHLIISLKDESMLIRLYSAQALGKIGKAAKAAIPTLTSIVNQEDEDSFVKFHARTAIKQINEK